MVSKQMNINGQVWEHVGAKDGGARPSGEYGGIYKSNDKTALIKRDNCAQDIAEFLGAKIHSATVPDHSPELFLARIPESDENPSKDGSDVYLVSVFFNNYKDLYKDIYTEAEIEIPNDRPRGIGIIGEGTKIFRSGLKDNGYTGFPEVMATSLLIGDFDVHWGNIGVVRNENQDPKLVRIDFGAAFEKLKEEINPHSVSEHLPGFGPTNHFKEFPREMKLNDQFIEELERVSKLNLDDTINKSFDELKKVYSEEALLEFGHRLGVNFQHNPDQQEDISETIKNHLKAIIQERQTSLKNFATELKIDLCIEKNTETGKWELNTEKFQQTVEDNPEYFKDVVEGKRKMTLYDLNHKDKFDLFSSNPNAHSLERVFIAMAHIINKILPESIQISTNENQIFHLIKDQYQQHSLNQVSNGYELTDNKPKSHLQKLEESRKANQSLGSGGLYSVK